MKTIKPLLTDDIRRLLADSRTLKALATVGQGNVPQVDFITDLSVNDDGQLEYLEFFEQSRTQKHLTHALWFSGRVTLTLRGSGGEIIEIEAGPAKIHISGELFQRRYAEVRASGRAAGLAGVWILTPRRVSDRSPAVLQQAYLRDEPFHLHLDALALS